MPNTLTSCPHALHPPPGPVLPNSHPPRPKHLTHPLHLTNTNTPQPHSSPLHLTRPFLKPSSWLLLLTIRDIPRPVSPPGRAPCRLSYALLLTNTSMRKPSPNRYLNAVRILMITLITPTHCLTYPGRLCSNKYVHHPVLNAQSSAMTP